MLGMDTPEQAKERMEELARRLLSHPQLSEPIEAMLQVMQEEIASGCSADAVEAKVVAQVRALGKAALQGWAKRAAAQARPGQDERPARRHGKKNSGG
jgi:hypothetical protein